MAGGALREGKLIFAEREREVSLSKGFHSVVANAGGSGFYRVRYRRNCFRAFLTHHPNDCR